MAKKTKPENIADAFRKDLSGLFSRYYKQMHSEHIKRGLARRKALLSK